jgi:membrane carboxypeptidase/penicillin-binding protein
LIPLERILPSSNRPPGGRDAVYSHEGIDVVRIARAAWSNMQAGEVVEASTITQQVAKMLF